MVRDDLEPSQVVLDVILRYTNSMPGPGEATLRGSTLIMCMANHRGQVGTYSVAVHPDGEAITGDNPRFVLYQIGEDVWKLAPSLSHEMIHCFITLVEVTPR